MFSIYLLFLIDIITFAPLALLARDVNWIWIYSLSLLMSLENSTCSLVTSEIGKTLTLSIMHHMEAISQQFAITAMLA